MKLNEFGERLSGKAEILTERERVGAYAVDGMVPAAVVIPADEAGVAAALQDAAALGLTVAPRGGGTKGWLGAPPSRLDLVLSTERLQGVAQYEPADLTVTVQGGITMGALREVLFRRGQTLPLDSPGGRAATAGGVIATAPPGPRRLAYGGVRDLVLGLRVALPDGRVIRTGGRAVKNAAGYDMNMFAGSLGTLGVITEATFKVRPAPEATVMMAAGFDDRETCLACAEVILASEPLPSSVVAVSPGAARRLTLPESHTLIVLFEESTANVRYQLERVVREVGRFGGRGLAVDLPPHLWERIADFGARTGASLCCRISTVISRVGEEMARPPVGEIEGEAVAFVGTGHVFRYAYGDDPAALDLTARAWLRPTEGTAVLERAPASLRARVPVWGEPGPSFAQMEGLKRAYDPAGILNPGRFAGGL